MYERHINCLEILSKSICLFNLYDMNRGIIYSEDLQMVIGADRNIDFAPIKAETKEIRTSAFSLCKQLKRVIIPDSVTKNCINEYYAEFLLNDWEIW